MGRSTRLIYSMMRTQARAQQRDNRRVNQQQIALMKAQTQAAKDAEKARKAYEKAANAEQKERAKLYTEAKIAEANLQNEQLEQIVIGLQTLLMNALSVDLFLDIQKLKQYPEPLIFNPGSLAIAEPSPSLHTYMPPELTALKKLLPGVKEKHAQEVANAQIVYRTNVAAHMIREQTRLRNLQETQVNFEHQVAEQQQQIAAQHAEVDEFNHAFKNRVPTAIINYFTMVLESSDYSEEFPRHTRIAFIPESKQLVIEYDLPPFDIVPTISSYKYVKARDEIAEAPRSLPQRKALYSSVIAQITLRTLHEIFTADRQEDIDVVVFNGYVDSVDRGTGRTEHTCIVTVRTSRDVFANLNLSKVDPEACLKALNASVSKNPTELAPVRPLLEFSMVDPRFIEEADVLSGLDQRPNLMELTPSEFESLITNLFQKMGLETRQTQASRDGGVDCVAFDPRPIFGGKVVIQAKRYKNVVGVSAVRDLYGTVHNEGASKGILITTSGYGKASFDFAEGKPLELYSGSNLLYFLAQYAGIEAKIEMPEDWKDARLD